MMFNKVILTSLAVAGLALTAVNQQFNKGKSTTDQAVKVTGSVSPKTVSTAVSSLDNIKTLEATAASQTVATSNDDSSSQADSSSDDSSQSQSQTQATVSNVSASAAQTQAAQATTATATTTAATATTTTASGDINWLISRESGGNVNAQNGSFYGIGQLSPSAYATYAAGQDYRGNYAVQLQAMQGYIAARYGSVANAISHFQSNGWY